MDKVDESNYRFIKEKYESIYGLIVFLRVLCIASIIIPLMVIGASDKIVSDITAHVVLVFIGIMGSALVVLAVVGSEVSSIIRACRQVELNLQTKCMIDKERLFDDALKNLGITDRIRFAKGNICVGNNKIYILDSADVDAVHRYADKMEDDSLKKQAENKVDLHSIDAKDILFFAKEGDVQYTTSISGGGGGGSSIGGAIVGGVLAGEAGAIIGSRKRVEEIKTVENKHDSRESVIRYKNDDKILEKRYEGFEVYKFLFKYIPEKDLLNVQLMKNISNDTIEKSEKEKQDIKTESNNKTDNAEEKLIKLKGLYEKNLIDKEEYEKKRIEIIDSI